MGGGSNGSAALNVEYKRRLGWITDSALHVGKKYIDELDGGI
ncbi:hypothetical protein [Marinagarivorans algicola]|nr:hypothetical protein [Marinagarivorans algicola]